MEQNDNVQTAFPGVEGAEAKDLIHLDQEVLKQQMLQLKNDRIILEGKREIKREKQKAFDEENKGLIEKIKSIDKEVVNQEKVIKDKVVAYYKETKDKEIPFGIKILLSKIIEYDSKKAFEWARENSKYLIVPESLNVSEFEKVMKTMTILPSFITKDEVPKATIPLKIEVGE